MKTQGLYKGELFSTYISVSVAQIKKFQENKVVLFSNFASGRTLPTQSTGPFDIAVQPSSLMKKLFVAKVYFSKCIFAKCTRLACLLSFASLFLLSSCWVLFCLQQPFSFCCATLLKMMVHRSKNKCPYEGAL